MKKKAKRWLLILLILMVGGVAMLNVLTYNHAHAMMHFTSDGPRTKKPEQLFFPAKLKVLIAGVNVPRPASDRLPSDLNPDCQSLTIRCPNDVTLSAWYTDQGNATPLVILFHGYAAEKTSLLPEAKMFLDLGASVLLVDFRGSGGSSESYTTIGIHEGEDVAAVVRYSQDNLEHSAFILFGQSMGAVAILRAVHEYGIEPDAVILEAVFDTMLNTIRNRFGAMGVPSFPCAELLVFWGGRQWGFNGFAHNPVEYARSVDCPILLMHGTDDPRATLTEGHRVFDALPGQKYFRKFESVGHGAYASIYPEEWQAAVEKIIMRVENRHIHDTASHRP